ncbi:unnamed protein product [Taenia asiatica]|uniref:Zinc finger protein n=1 Tax=Taenia asiatica TaxID=60517 RepID=A0A0R3W1V4_TAEAS|nr:unnamed protein product [Taenia asiatica]
MAAFVDVALRNIRYKTELCKHYKRRGYCPMGIYCHFAHGIDELRYISSHPKYRTEQCIYFERERRCPYGSQCAFTHFGNIYCCNNFLIKYILTINDWSHEVNAFYGQRVTKTNTWNNTSGCS